MTAPWLIFWIKSSSRSVGDVSKIHKKLPQYQDLEGIARHPLQPRSQNNHIHLNNFDYNQLKVLENVHVQP